MRLLLLSIFLFVETWCFSETENYAPRGPTLIRFDLDMNYGGLKLYFDQIVQAKSFKLDHTLLYSEEFSSSTRITFSLSREPHNDLSLQGNSSVIEVFLQIDEFAQLITRQSIAKSSESTFVSLTEGAVLSEFNIPSEPGIVLQVTNFVTDTSPPYVTQYDFSMDNGELVIEFSEPMEVRSFRLEGLAFQALKNALNRDQYIPLQNVTDDSILVSNFNRRISILIGDVNLNSLKRIAHLCDSPETTFLSAWKPFVRDITGNDITIQSFQRIFGMKVTHYTPDRQSPMLISWDLDLSRGRIILHFSEVLHMPLFNYSGIILCDTKNISESSNQMRVNDPIIESYNNTENPVIQLNVNQFNFLKYSIGLADSLANTYLVLEEFLAVDTSLSQNRYLGLDASPYNARQVSNLTLDHVAPDLVSAELDLTEKTLTLIFNEVININSLYLEQLTLQSSPSIKDNTEVFQFRDHDIIISVVDTDRVVLNLASGFSELKSFNSLGRSIQSTFIAYTHYFLQDQSGNNVVEIPTDHARMISNFVTDNETPLLLNWRIDMSSDLMILTFTEPVDVETLDLSGIVLQNQRLLSKAGLSVFLSKTSLISREANEIVISLSSQDRSELKKSASLCQDKLSCFLFFSRSIGTDIGTLTPEGRFVTNSIAMLEEGIPPEIFIPDTVAPFLERVDIDLNSGKLFLTFSEPVRTNWFDPAGILFYDGTNDEDLFLQLSPYTFSEYVLESIDQLTLIMTRRDFFTLKSRSLFNPSHKLWLSFANETFLDTSGNFLNSLFLGDGENKITRGSRPLLISPTLYIPDTTSPAIVCVSTTPSSLTIYFDDAIVLSSIKKEKIFISSFESIKTLSLTDSSLLRIGNIDYKIEISLFEVSSLIHRSFPLWSNQRNSYLYMDNAAIVDTSLNPNTKINPLGAFRIGGTLLNFRLNMLEGFLIFETAFPISFSLSNTDPFGFKLVNLDTKQDFTLNGFSSLTLSPDEVHFSLGLLNLDLLNLRKTGMISTSGSIKLSIRSNAIMDSVGLQLNSSLLLNCAQVVVDTSRLEISYYQLNMAKGYLDIFFSKDVLIRSVDLSRLYFVNSRINPVYLINLADSCLHALSSGLVAATWIRIDLNCGSSHPSVRDLIHLSDIISLTPSTTYLIIKSGFVHDTSIPPNFNIEVPQENAIQPQTITPDRSPPFLLSYSIDFTNRKLTLSFSEAVNASTIKSHRLKLLANPSQSSTNVYWLSKNTVVSEDTLRLEATSIIVLLLSSYDVDNLILMYPNLCSSKENTYLSYPSGVIRDIAISSNAMQQVFDIYAQQVTTYIFDTAPPYILQYNLSIESQRITFFFNEMINCSASDVDKIALQSTPFIGTLTERYFLHSSRSFIECSPLFPFTRTLSLWIGREDLLSLKTFQKLLKSSLTSNLYLKLGAFHDVSHNPILPLKDGHTLQVSDFVGDLTAPQLLGFMVDEQLILHLTFSEPMKVSSFDISKITFHNHRIPTLSYTLTRSSSLVSVDRTMREFRIYLHTDYDFMYSTTDIFTMQNTSFLSLSSECVTDTAGNDIVAIPVNKALKMGPILVDWDLNINRGEISLYFSQKVEPEFSPSGLIIQNHQENPTSQVILTTNTVVSQITDPFYSPGTAYVVSLHQRDLANIKLIFFATPKSDFYLYSQSGLTRSSAPETIVSPLNSSETLLAISVGKYESDITGPEILEIFVDLNRGISIFFDEPVIGESIKIEKISLLSSSSGGEMLISQFDPNQLPNSPVLHLNLTQRDLNFLKFINAEGTLDVAIFQPQFVTDMFGNAPRGGLEVTVPITRILSDIIPPILLACTLNFGNNEINFQFDEIVDPISISVDQIQLFSANHKGPGTYNLSLSNASFIEFDPSHRESNLTINLGLFRIDSLALQAHPIIGKSPTTTYISIPNFFDISGNINNYDEATECDIIQDYIPPFLESFDFFLSLGQIHIVLYFSEVISLTSFSCDEYIFLSGVPAVEEYNPAVPDCTLVTIGDSREIEYLIPTISLSLIGASPESTYLSVPNPSTTDLSGNLLVTLRKESAIRVGPRLSNFGFNIQEGEMILIFSKEIDLSQSFDCSKLGLSVRESGNSYFLIPNSATATSYFQNSNGLDFVVKIKLFAQNLLRIKEIYVEESELDLLLGDNLFFDSIGVPMPPLAQDFSAIYVVEDTAPPQIVNLTFDLSMNVIKITLDEPIRLSSVDPKKFVLQSQPGFSGSFFQLTGGRIDQIIDETFVFLLLYLTDSDSCSIKLVPNLAKNLTTTYLSTVFHPFEDFSGNSLEMIPSSDALQFDRYIPDTISPMLRFFDLNMDDGILQLYFSEPINWFNIDPSAISIQSRFSQGTTGFYTLSHHSRVFPLNDLVISIILSNEDITGIKNTSNLARKPSSTYLTAVASLAADLVGNEMIPIVDGQALLVSKFIPDSTPPLITGISLDMGASTLAFFFSELVGTEMVDVTGVVIHDDFINYKFTATSNVTLKSPKFAFSLAFQLSSIDTNAIKWRWPLALNENHSSISVDSILCSDVYNNPVIPIPFTAPAKVSIFRGDKDPPKLIKYSLDMDVEMMTLEFNEAIRASSLLLEQGILQNTETKRYGNFVNLSSCQAEVGLDSKSNLVVIPFDSNLINTMKWRGVGISQKSSYFSWGSEFVADGYGNNIIPLWDGSVLGNHPILPTSYVPDTTSPVLRRWLFDRETCIALLIFSEPVRLLRCTGIHLAVREVNVTFTSCQPQFLEHGTILKFNFLNETELLSLTSPGELKIIVENATVADLVDHPNFIKSVSLPESSPDCTTCPTGSFLKSKCTALTDRICEPCRTCGLREWILDECTSEHDTGCLACSDCRLGTYISSHCSLRRDTQCSPCTSCGSLEFQSRDCLYGLDSLCDSCKHCSFTDPLVKALCQTEEYFWWNRENCCQTVDGEQVLCHEIMGTQKNNVL